MSTLSSLLKALITSFSLKSFSWKRRKNLSVRRNAPSCWLLFTRITQAFELQCDQNQWDLRMLPVKLHHTLGVRRPIYFISMEIFTFPLNPQRKSKKRMSLSLHASYVFKTSVSSWDRTQWVKPRPAIIELTICFFRLAFITAKIALLIWQLVARVSHGSACLLPLEWSWLCSSSENRWIHPYSDVSRCRAFSSL